MMFNTVFAHLQTLSNNIYTRQSSPITLTYLKPTVETLKKNKENYSVLTIKTPEQLSTFLIVNFGHDLLPFLVSCC